MRYSFKEKKDELYDSLIEVSDLTSIVTVNSLLDHIENTRKVKKGQEGQIKVNQEIMKRAEEKLPSLKDFKEEDYGIAFQFFAKALEIKQAEGVIKDCDEVINTYQQHLDSIEAELGIELPKITPYNGLEETKKEDGQGDVE